VYEVFAATPIDAKVEEPSVSIPFLEVPHARGLVFSRSLQHGQAKDSSFQTSP
jgi:hypothetical protein